MYRPMKSLLKVKRLRENAKLPARASNGAAAYDLCAALDRPLIIAPGQFAGVPTGIAIELADDTLVALVFSRSGHGIKKGVSLTNSVGVIDSDYRGELCVGMINHGSEPFTVADGDRIAQLLVTYTFTLDILEVNDLSDTIRGGGGFGSTGQN